jgi:hypothetical protein
MIKKVLPAFLVLTVAVFLVYAQTTTAGNLPKVIKTLSDDSQVNSTTQDSSADSSSTAPQNESKPLKVIRTLSDGNQDHPTTQNSPDNPSSLPSKKVKYLSGFTEDSNKPNPPEAQDNSTVNLQNNEQVATAQVTNSEQANSNSENNIAGDDFKERYKVLKSK